MLALLLAALPPVSSDSAEQHPTLPALNTVPFTSSQSSPGSQGIQEYVRFLETQHQSPIQYILSLFERYDLVVLCERAHPEVTQYAMLHALASDRRFQEKVGHIFTECGSVNLRPAVEEFLTNDDLTEQEAKQKLQEIYRNFDFQAIWDKTNFYDFLEQLRRINRTLSKNRRVHIWPCDIPSDWSRITEENYNQMQQLLSRRDRIMADHVTAKFEELQRSPDVRQKALVIMNYRHAFPHFRLERGGKVRNLQNMTGYLLAGYPSRVANVMINSTGIIVGDRDNPAGVTAIQDGKWDAAFKVVGNPDLGFDFKESPFGKDKFDYFPFPIPVNYTYQDVFTGFVFYKPLNEHRMSFGVPGLLDAVFTAELVRRCKITGRRQSTEDLKREIQEQVGTIRISGYDNREIFPRNDCAAKVQQWLTQKERIEVRAAPANREP